MLNEIRLRDLRLQREIDQLKEAEPYKIRFATEDIRCLSQAIDILWHLAKEAYAKDATNVGLDILTDAKCYLDKQLKKALANAQL